MDEIIQHIEQVIEKTKEAKLWWTGSVGPNDQGHLTRKGESLLAQQLRLALAVAKMAKEEQSAAKPA